MANPVKILSPIMKLEIFASGLTGLAHKDVDTKMDNRNKNDKKEV